MCEELRHLIIHQEKDVVPAFPKKSVFASFHRQDTPLMDAEEWHTHCDVILRANAAFNLKMLLRLITARVLLMAACTQELSGPTRASALFCGDEYAPRPTTEEKALFILQRGNSCIHQVLIMLLCGILPCNRYST